MDVIIETYDNGIYLKVETQRNVFSKYYVDSDKESFNLKTIIGGISVVKRVGELDVRKEVTEMIFVGCGICVRHIGGKLG